MTSRTILASVFAAFLSVSTFANNIEHGINIAGTYLKLTANDKNKDLLISADNISKEGIELFLETAQGEVLYNEKVKNIKNFTKNLELTRLSKGSYALVVKKNTTKTVQQFEVTENNIVISQDIASDYKAPAIAQRGKKIDINVSSDIYTNIHVSVYNNEGKLVFENMNYVVMGLNKSFNLDNLTAGVYIVEVIAGDDKMFSTINL